MVIRCSLGGVPLTIIGMHAKAPSSPAGAREHNRQFSGLIAWAKQRHEATIVLGDLTITPWSPYFHDVLEQAGLGDSRPKSGIQGTWPAGFPLLGIPIDHCLVSAWVGVKNRTVEGDVGSDHYPILLDLSVLEQD